MSDVKDPPDDERTPGADVAGRDMAGRTIIGGEEPDRGARTTVRTWASALLPVAAAVLVLAGLYGCSRDRVMTRPFNGSAIYLGEPEGRPPMGGASESEMFKH